MTDANKAHVIVRLVQHELIDCRIDELRALRHGFHTVHWRSHIALFEGGELRELMCGVPRLDAASLWQAIHLDERCGEALGGWLAQHATLKHLDLSANNITDAGSVDVSMRACCRALSNRSLRALSAPTPCPEPPSGHPRISPATMDTARGAPPPHIMSIRRPSTHRVISSWVSQRNAYFASRTVASTLHS